MPKTSVFGVTAGYYIVFTIRNQRNLAVMASMVVDMYLESDTAEYYVESYNAGKMANHYVTKLKSLTASANHSMQFLYSFQKELVS